mgnify:FL=1
MAVPDTNTFNLINVTDELGLGSGDSLQDCFNDSSAGDFITSFNPNAFGLNNNLLNFRGYDGSDGSLTPFIYTEYNYVGESYACAAIDPILLGGMKLGYHDGSSNPLSVGDQVYEIVTWPDTYQALTGGGQGKYWGGSRDYTAQTFKADSSGVVTYVNTCAYTGCGILSLAETTTKPYNIAANNGTLTVDYNFLAGTLQYNLNGGSWITPTQTVNSGSFTLTGFSPGSGTIYFRTFGAWPGCARQLNYTVENANFFVTPMDVYKNVDPYLSVIGTTGTISIQVYNVNSQRVIGPTSTNPVNVGGLAIGSYFIYVTQTNPSYTYPYKTFRVF